MTFYSLPSLFFLAFILCNCSKECSACWKEEKEALLEIKASFFVPGTTWPLNWGGVDCCIWEGVSCDSVTGRVTFLLLGETWPASFEGNMLNSTLFLPFDELKSLDLSSNSIEDFTRPTSDAWSSLRKLQVLDLSSNGLSDDIFESLAKVSSLKTLLLNNNGIEDLSQSKDLSTLKLEVLDLSSNDLYGTFRDLGNWPSLKVLSLQGNVLNGTLPSKELCKMINLQELDLSQNKFTGDLPSCMRNLTSLIFLDLSQNQFQIKFPNSIFTNMTSLRYLSLSGNQLKGTLFLNSFSNHSKLKILELPSQSSDFSVETEFPMTNPLFQLEGLELSNSNLNNNTGVIPTFLLNQHELYYLDLSNTNSIGSFPNWLIENNKNLLSLNLKNNFLTGMLVLHSQTNSSLLDASEEKLFGELPNDTQGLDQEEFMATRISGYIEGVIHSYFQGIDLSYNLLEGSIPEEIGNMKWILVLNLSNNFLNGSIPKSLTNLTDLGSLDLSHNDLTGQIPVGLANLYFLEFFSVAYNKLSGAILGRDFSESSYEGNPNLCGPPLATSCGAAPSSSPNAVPPSSSNEDVPSASPNEDVPPESPIEDRTGNSMEDDWFDLIVMVASFVVPYIIGFWGFIFMIYYQRNWNRAFCLAVDKYTNLFLVKITLLMRRLRTADQL